MSISGYDHTSAGLVPPMFHSMFFEQSSLSSMMIIFSGIIDTLRKKGFAMAITKNPLFQNNSDFVRWPRFLWHSVPRIKILALFTPPTEACNFYAQLLCDSSLLNIKIDGVVQTLLLVPLPPSILAISPKISVHYFDGIFAPPHALEQVL